MFNTSLRIVNNVGDAEDVLHDAFVDAFKHLKDFRHSSPFWAWLKRIVIHKSISLLRKRKLQLVDIEDIQVADNSADDESVDEIAFQYKVEEIRKAIQKLPDGYRAVVSLYLLEEDCHEQLFGRFCKKQPGRF
ncbi:MAG: hypothetical protein NVSMB7_09320 [Chitinophagaceae bacterium]